MRLFSVIHVAILPPSLFHKDPSISPVQIHKCMWYTDEAEVRNLKESREECMGGSGRRGNVIIKIQSVK